MKLRLEAVMLPNWPPLAWVATCRANTVELRHGSGVEVGQDWFGELTWDAKYEEAGFDRAEHVFGSGGRMHRDGCTFVSSISVLDRLHRHSNPHKQLTWVSNTLPGLMRVAQLEVSLERQDYPQIFSSLCRGLKQYDRQVPMRTGHVELVYRNNLQWDGVTLQEVPKRIQDFAPRSYEEYHHALVQVMSRLAENWCSSARSKPFNAISTVSTGYDSTAASAVGKLVGLKEAMTITHARAGNADDGSQIAQYLGIRAHRISREAWQNSALSEVPYLASDAKGEDVYFAGAEHLLRQRVLITGYGGTRVWGLGPKLSPNFERSDQSGLSHTEARLHTGYLHLPLPFILATNPGALRQIAASPSMQPWHVPGKYNCPIARRIVEEQGVPREHFGMHKSAASILLFDRHQFLSERSRTEFLTWYQRNVAPSLGLGTKICRGLSQLSRESAAWLQAGCQSTSQVWPNRLLCRLARSSRLREYAVHETLFNHLFPWACTIVAAERYAL